MIPQSFPSVALFALFPLIAFSAERKSGDAEFPRVVLTPVQRANLDIRSAESGPAEIARTAFALGDVRTDPRGESSASTRVPGRVIELSVALGDTVRKGDRLATIESRQPGVDPVKVELTAVADGTVVEVLTRAGEPVSPDAPLLRLADLSKLVVEARIPQRYAGEIAPGVTVARCTPEGGLSRELVLNAFAPMNDPVSGTLVGRFFLNDSKGGFIPGRRARFQVILERKTHPVTVPASAVQGEKGDYVVFVEKTPGVYEKVPVKLLAKDDLRAAVEGVPAGVKVVSHGGYSLRYSDSSNTSLREAMEAAHGHKHGPGGEEPGAASAKETHAEDDGHDHASGDMHDEDDGHDHAEGDGHDHAEGDGHDHADAAAHKDAPGTLKKTPAAGNSALREAMEAAHGHKHGPDGQEPEGDAAKKRAGSGVMGWLMSESGVLFLATLALGEALLLALAVNALRRKENKEARDA